VQQWLSTRQIAVDAHCVSSDPNNDPQRNSARSSVLLPEVRKTTNGAKKTNAVAGIICARVKVVREAKVASSPNISELLLDEQTRAMNHRAAAIAIAVQTQKLIIIHRRASPTGRVDVDTCLGCSSGFGQSLRRKANKSFCSFVAFIATIFLPLSVDALSRPRPRVSVSLPQALQSP
jgi:hypothetical protein